MAQSCETHLVSTFVLNNVERHIVFDANFMWFGNFTRLRLQEEKSRGGVRPVPHSVELTLEASAAEVADAEAGDRVRPLEERVQIPEERALKNKMIVDCDVPSRNPSCSLLSKL